MTKTSYKDQTDYIRRLFAPETPALQAVRAALTDPQDKISIHPQEGKLLQLLVRLCQAKTVVEIGTLGGYSALWMADALPEDGKIHTLEKDDRRAALATKHFQAFDAARKITLVQGDALASLAALSDKAPFDMVFIDADKINYPAYLDWAETHVRKGGLIVGDNTFLFGTVWQDAPGQTSHGNPLRSTAWQAMRDFNARLADPEKYQSILLPTAEGMTVAQKLF
jgi:predicted O-methyltransferase YrrM